MRSLELVRFPQKVENNESKQRNNISNMSSSQSSQLWKSQYLQKPQSQQHFVDCEDDKRFDCDQSSSPNLKHSSSSNANPQSLKIQQAKLKKIVNLQSSSSAQQFSKQQQSQQLQQSQHQTSFKPLSQTYNGGRSSNVQGKQLATFFDGFSSSNHSSTAQIYQNHAYNSAFEQQMNNNHSVLLPRGSGSAQSQSSKSMNYGASKPMNLHLSASIDYDSSVLLKPMLNATMMTCVATTPSSIGGGVLGMSHPASCGVNMSKKKDANFFVSPKVSQKRKNINGIANGMNSSHHNTTAKRSAAQIEVSQQQLVGSATGSPKVLRKVSSAVAVGQAAEQVAGIDGVGSNQALTMSTVIASMKAKQTASSSSASKKGNSKKKLEKSVELLRESLRSVIDDEAAAITGANFQRKKKKVKPQQSQQQYQQTSGKKLVGRQSKSPGAAVVRVAEVLVQDKQSIGVAAELAHKKRLEKIVSMQRLQQVHLAEDSKLPLDQENVEHQQQQQQQQLIALSRASVASAPKSPVSAQSQTGSTAAAATIGSRQNANNQNSTIKQTQQMQTYSPNATVVLTSSNSLCSPFAKTKSRGKLSRLQQGTSPKRLDTQQQMKKEDAERVRRERLGLGFLNEKDDAFVEQVIQKSKERLKQSTLEGSKLTASSSIVAASGEEVKAKKKMVLNSEELTEIHRFIASKRKWIVQENQSKDFQRASKERKIHENQASLQSSIRGILARIAKKPTEGRQASKAVAKLVQPPPNSTKGVLANHFLKQKAQQMYSPTTSDTIAITESIDLNQQNDKESQRYQDLYDEYRKILLTTTTEADSNQYEYESAANKQKNSIKQLSNGKQQTGVQQLRNRGIPNKNRKTLAQNTTNQRVATHDDQGIRGRDRAQETMEKYCEISQRFNRIIAAQQDIQRAAAAVVVEQQQQQSQQLHRQQYGAQFAINKNNEVEVPLKVPMIPLATVVGHDASDCSGLERRDSASVSSKRSHSVFMNINENYPDHLDDGDDNVVMGGDESDLLGKEEEYNQVALQYLNNQATLIQKNWKGYQTRKILQMLLDEFNREMLLQQQQQQQQSQQEYPQQQMQHQQYDIQQQEQLDDEQYDAMMAGDQDDQRRDKHEGDEEEEEEEYEDQNDASDSQDKIVNISTIIKSSIISNCAEQQLEENLKQQLPNVQQSMVESQATDQMKGDEIHSTKIEGDSQKVGVDDSDAIAASHEQELLRLKELEIEKWNVIASQLQNVQNVSDTKQRELLLSQLMEISEQNKNSLLNSLKQNSSVVVAQQLSESQRIDEINVAAAAAAAVAAIPGVLTISQVTNNASNGSETYSQQNGQLKDNSNSIQNKQHQHNQVLPQQTQIAVATLPLQAPPEQNDKAPAQQAESKRVSEGVRKVAGAPIHQDLNQLYLLLTQEITKDKDKKYCLSSSLTQLHSSSNLNSQRNSSRARLADDAGADDYEMGSSSLYGLQDPNASSSSFFDRGSFKHFNEKKLKELMKNEQIEDIIRYREQSIQMRHSTQAAYMDRMLSENIVSPRTYIQNKQELDQWAKQEHADLMETRCDLEKSIRRAVDSISKAKRDLDFSNNCSALADGSTAAAAAANAGALCGYENDDDDAFNDDDNSVNRSRDEYTLGQQSLESLSVGQSLSLKHSIQQVVADKLDADDDVQIKARNAEVIPTAAIKESLKTEDKKEKAALAEIKLKSGNNIIIDEKFEDEENDEEQRGNHHVVGNNNNTSSSSSSSSNPSVTHVAHLNNIEMVAHEGFNTINEEIKEKWRMNAQVEERLNEQLNQVACLDKSDKFGIASNLFVVDQYLLSLFAYIKCNSYILKSSIRYSTIKITIEHYSQQFVSNINTPFGFSPQKRLKLIHGYDSYLEVGSEQSLEEFTTLPFVLSEELFIEFEQDIIGNGEEEKDQIIKEFQHIHNKAIFDTFNESLNLFRPYFALGGSPYSWSYHEKNIVFCQASQENLERLLHKAKKKVIEWASFLCGIINENESPPLALPNRRAFMHQDDPIDSNDSLNANDLTNDYSPLQSLLENHSMQPENEYFAQSREERLSRMLLVEIFETEFKWQLFEDEKAEVVMELSDLVFEDLVEEIVDEMVSPMLLQQQQQQ